MAQRIGVRFFRPGPCCRWLWYVPVLLSLTTACMVLFWMPLNGEDYAFARSFDGLALLDRWDWITEKTVIQFTQWNARFGEQLAVVWLNLPGPVLWLMSLMAFLAFHWMTAWMGGIARVTPSSHVTEKQGMFWSLCLIFLLWPAFETFFWRLMIAGYLVPMLLSLAVLTVYASARAMKTLCTGRWSCLGWMVMAFLAGWSFENVPLAIAVYMAWSWWLLPGHVRRWRMLLPLVALLSGWAMLMAVPSTAYRIGVYRQMYGIGSPDIAYYMGRVGDVVGVFWLTGWPVLLLSLLALMTLRLMQYQGRVRYERQWWWLPLPAVLSVCAVVPAPYTEPRAFMLAWCIMFALVVEAVCQIWRHLPRCRSGCVLLLLAGVVAEAHLLTIHYRVHQAFSARVSYIRSHLPDPVCHTGPEQGLPIKSLQFDTENRFFNNRDAWIMHNLITMTSYYGCWLRVESDRQVSAQH